MDSFLDVLITGGARGIGYGIVRALAQKNCNIGFCGRAPQAKIAPILTALRADFSNHFEYYSCDISNTDARRKLIQNFMTDFGCIDVLINNAGVAPENRADILDMTEESYHRLIKINAAGPFFLTQLAAKEIIANTNKKFHCIINISSVSASYASINRGEYCISKAAVSMATKLWSVRLADHNIPVYEIRPGIIKSDMTKVVTEKYSKLIEGGLTLQRRWGEPADIGKTVAMLTDGALAYSTGQVINVDGGLTIERF